MKTFGFTFDEKILSTDSIEGFFHKLPCRPNHLELAPDLTLFKTSIYKEIAQYTTNLNFHVPYFIAHKKYDFAFENFTAFDSFFSIIDDLRPYSVKKPSIILHASQEKDKILALDQTKRGIDYLLNFITKKNLDLRFCLENLEVASTRSSYDLLKIQNIVEEFQTPQLSICYDIAHDYYGAHNFSLANEEVLSQIDYYHVHGKDTMKHQDLNHLPLDLLKSIKGKGDINIELLKATCQKDYTETLINNLTLLKNL